jgi:hypothetical protein
MQRTGRSLRDALSDRPAIARFAAVTIAFALLAACQSPLTREQIAALDYGPRPDNYEQIVRDYLRPRLNEPSFAVIEFRAGPAPLYQKDALLNERQYGWAVCVTVNERDPRGTYFDPYPMVVYIRRGAGVAANGGALERAAGLRYAREQCRQLGYEAP